MIVKNTLSKCELFRVMPEGGFVAERTAWRRMREFPILAKASYERRIEIKICIGLANGCAKWIWKPVIIKRM
jgi:hypothetical protein